MRKLFLALLIALVSAQPALALDATGGSTNASAISAGTLSTTYGGLGANNSSATGTVRFNAGTATIDARQWFGDGSDGVHTCNGAETITRDMFYSTLTDAAGCARNVAAATTSGLSGGTFAIFVSGTYDISAAPAGATIANGVAGNAAVVTAGGVVPTTTLVAGSLPAPIAAVAGSAGGTTTGTQAAQPNTTSCFLGGAAGSNGAGGSGSSGAGGAQRTSTSANFTQCVVKQFLTPAYAGGITGLRPGQSGIPGSSGGGDTTAGGGGGGAGTGGGTIAIYAKTIARGTNATAAIFQAKGAVGGAGAQAAGGNRGGGGGSGGGGGGVVIIGFCSETGSTITNAIDVSGGAGGNGGALQGTGTAGGGGNGGDGGCAILMNICANTITNTCAAFGSGTAASGATGGAGATEQVNL